MPVPACSYNTAPARAQYLRARRRYPQASLPSRGSSFRTVCSPRSRRLAWLPGRRSRSGPSATV